MKPYLLIAAVAATLSGCVQLTQIAESKPVRLTPAQVQQIQSTMSHDLFDPAAAQFRNVRAADVVLVDGKTARRVCGEINGKNRMGAYVGFEIFGGVIENGRFVKHDFPSACEPF